MSLQVELHLDIRFQVLVTSQRLRLRTGVGFLWSPTKNPALGVRGFSGSGGQYWTRTSDLYHVKVAL